MIVTAQLTELIKEYAKPIKIKARTFILKEGDHCQKMYFINKGCVRVSFNNNDGKDLTAQFFFEGDAVTILESFLYNKKCPFSIETIEECDFSVITKKDFELLIKNSDAFKIWFYETAVGKLLTLTQRLLSFIINKPQQRYDALMQQQPQIFNRVPQHFIASYLGITPVSLSRIRNRKTISM